jgi:hypothetical protein
MSSKSSIAIKQPDLEMSNKAKHFPKDIQIPNWYVKKMSNIIIHQTKLTPQSYHHISA